MRYTEGNKGKRTGRMDIEKLIESMTTEELCGQLLCFDASGARDADALFARLSGFFPGSLYVSNIDAEVISALTRRFNAESRVPLMIAADIENGPGSEFAGQEMLPHPMAWGACGDAELLERAGRETARICRRLGVHWTFSPVVDINLNPDNPVTNIRSVSDDPELVAKMAGAYLAGLQSEGLMVAGCKHFPGDGTDSRNQHFVTSVNRLSRAEWEKSFGRVYREIIAAGAASVMVAHISLPSFQEEEIDPFFGPAPAVLSRELMTGLLKGELGFNGCIVSDAMSMIGSCSRCPSDELAARFVQAGGDIVLFPDLDDFGHLVAAVKSGYIPAERLADAVRRILRLKERAGLFAERPPEIPAKSDIAEISREIGERSIRVVRDTQNILPLAPPPGSKFLLVNLFVSSANRREDNHLASLSAALRERGYEVEVLENPKHYAVRERMQDAYAVLLNVNVSPMNCTGGSLRLGWEQLMAVWRGYILEHPRLVAISFGDPYKLFEMPYLKTYINAFSYSESSQRGAVRLILGETESRAGNPVKLDDLLGRA